MLSPFAINVTFEKVIKFVLIISHAVSPTEKLIKGVSYIVVLIIVST